MAKEAVKETPVAKLPESSVPAYLQGVKSNTTSNMRTEDLIIPRIALMQALSPQVVNNPRSVFPGTFLHNVFEEMVSEDGKSFEFIPFQSRFFYILFAPRGDDRGVLARADDGIHWNPASGEFKVKPKKHPSEVTYKMAPTVEASGLSKFGSSIPGDNDSQPAATLIYEYLAFLPQKPEWGPVVLSLARSQIKRGKVINATVGLGKAPMSAYKFIASVTQEQGAEGPYFNWQFKRGGWATEEEFKIAEDMASQFGNRQYKAAGEDEFNNDTGDAPADAPKNSKGF